MNTLGQKMNKEFKLIAVLYSIDFLITVSAVVGMECTSASQCTDLLAYAACSSSHCACVSEYTGTTCTGKTKGSVNVFFTFENRIYTIIYL